MENSIWRTQMKTYDNLDKRQQIIVVTRAIEWRVRHRKHVDNIAKEASGSYSPSGSDLGKPELWKGSHWRWFNQMCPQVRHDDTSERL
jgi:uncharacterized protein with PIN domain